MVVREIGPAGTISRIVVGAAAIAIPVALEDIGSPGRAAATRRQCGYGACPNAGDRRSV